MTFFRPSHTLLTSCLVLALLTGCVDERTVYHHFEDTSLDGWKRTDTLSFPLPRLSADSTYTLTASIRITPTYPYADLRLVVEQPSATSVRSHRATLRFLLAHPAGTFTATGVDLEHHSLPIPTPLLHPTHATLRIYHIMRREELPGVNDVGLQITK